MTISDPFAPTTGARNAFGKSAPVGHTVTGTILSIEERQQVDFDTNKPEFWDDGKPKMQVVVKLQTTLQEDGDDDGVRALYCKGGHRTPGPKGGQGLKEAIVTAGKNAGAPIAVGGTLTVRYIEDGEPPKRGFNGPKLYVAKFEAGAPAPAADPFA